jgi:hypothetical protein
MIKRGITRLSVSQLFGKETKWPPMVPRFLLHDAADMSIRGDRGKRELSLWGRVLGGTAAARRHFVFWKASCAVAVHSNVLGPSFRRSVNRRNTCAQLGKKNGGKNSPCPENVAFD